MNVVFFGSSAYVIPVLEQLKKHKHLSYVITTEKDPKDPIVTYCNQYNLPYKSIASFSEIDLKSLIVHLQSNVGVLADFGLIVPRSILALFPHGIINIHPSLLPKYRGPTPVQSAMLNGEKVTGVTIIKLDEEIDHGPILAQEKEPIYPTDTAETLHKRLFIKGANLLISIIRMIEQNRNPQETPQDHKKATFTQPLTRQNGFFDAKNPPTKEKLDRMIRAYFPWPGVWTRLPFPDGKEKNVKFLPEKKLQVEGKKPVTYKDFINGYPEMKEWINKISTSASGQNFFW